MLTNGRNRAILALFEVWQRFIEKGIVKEDCKGRKKEDKMSDEKTTVLSDCLGAARNLAKLVDYAADSIVSKTILDKPAGTITLFAFDKGQKLSEHTTPYDAVVQVLDGVAAVTIDGRENKVAAGDIIIMPGNIPHAVAATKRFKMLLSMIRTKV
jgi:quercetin dioxygenase-like cupin family protein